MRTGHVSAMTMLEATDGDAQPGLRHHPHPDLGHGRVTGVMGAVDPEGEIEALLRSPVPKERTS